MSVTFVRYIVACALALVLLALLAVIGLALERGVDINSSQLLGLFAFMGTLVGVLANLLATRQVAGVVSDVQEKVNGHLSAHIGHTDDQVRMLVDRRLQQHGLVAGDQEPKP